MRFTIFFTLLLISFSSCYLSPPYEKVALLGINNGYTAINPENWAESIDGSFYDEGIEKITLGFNVRGNSFNIETARDLLLKGIEDSLTSINNNQKIIPYLKHYPFTLNDLSYSISIYSDDDKLLGDAHLWNGNLVYHKTNPHTSIRDMKIERIYEEPYSEALQKVKAGLAIPFSQQSADPI